MSVQSDVAYGSLPEQALDICAPKGVAGPVPAFVVFHGGGWRGGDKSAGADGTLTRQVCNQIASMGFVAFNANYRLMQNDSDVLPNPDAINVFPTPLIDAQLAVRWVRAHAETYGIDADHICSWGDSAGSYMAVMLGLLGADYPSDDPSGQLYTDVSPAVNCVIDNSGPTDFLVVADGPMNNDDYKYQAEFVNSRDEAALLTVSPLSYVSPQSAPTIITQGNQDTTVLPLNATEFLASLQQNGVPAKLISYNAGHVFQGLQKSQSQAIIQETIQWAATHSAPTPPIASCSRAGGAPTVEMASCDISIIRTPSCPNLYVQLPWAADPDTCGAECSEYGSGYCVWNPNGECALSNPGIGAPATLGWDCTAPPAFGSYCGQVQ